MSPSFDKYPCLISLSLIHILTFDNFEEENSDISIGIAEPTEKDILEKVPTITCESVSYTHLDVYKRQSLGTSMKEVSCRLGHSMLTTTCNTYTHSMQFADRRAAEALDQFKII